MLLLKEFIRAVQLSEDLIEEGHPGYYSWTLPQQLCLSCGLSHDESTVIEAGTVLF